MAILTINITLAYTGHDGTFGTGNFGEGFYGFNYPPNGIPILNYSSGTNFNYIPTINISNVTELEGESIYYEWWNATQTNNNTYSTCYQESANVSTSCGGLDTGSYSFSGTFSSSTNNMVDENYGTGASSSSGEADLYSNYSKPVNFVNGTIWQSMHCGGSCIIENFSITGNCEAQNPLQFKMATFSIGTDKGYCWDGNSWSELFSSGSVGGKIWEEAVFWNITNSSIPSLIYSLIQNSTSSEYTPSWSVSGNYSFLIKTMDGHSYGNNSDLYSYTYDIVIPSISIGSNASTIYYNTYLNVNANVTDDYSLLSCLFTENYTSTSQTQAVTGTSNTCSFDYSVSAPKYSTINFTIQVNDSNNNLNQSSLIFEVANSIPAVTNVTIQPPTFYINSSICGKYDFNDVDSDTNQSIYQWYVNNEVYASTNDCLNLSIFNYPSNFTFEVTPNDGEANGTKVNSSTYFMLNSLPTIFDITPHIGNFGSSVPITCYATDDNMDLLRYSLYGYYKENSTDTISWKQFTSNSTSSSYTWVVSSLPQQYAGLRCVATDGYGSSTYTSPYNITLAKIDIFQVIDPRFTNDIYTSIPWSMGIKCQINSIPNITIYATSVDCNSDGNLDYYFNHNESLYTSVNDYFKCVNLVDGNYTLTGTCIIKKSENITWGNLCSISNDQNLCGKQVYYQYEVQQN